MFPQLFDRLLDSRFWALALKEIRQILKNRQLLVMLLVPPTVQILVFGFALSPEVTGLKIGVVDYAMTPTSRELVAALTENRVFVVEHYFLDEKQLAEQVQQGRLTAGLIIPPNFERQLGQARPAELQLFIDAVDANTAGIAQGYASQIITQFNRQRLVDLPPPLIQPQTRFIYNPGLVSSWFFVPGVMGAVLTLTSSLVSSSTVVREKDTGTLEQLLMTPASGWEILAAKIVPLFVLLMGDVFLALAIARFVFQVPFRGSLLLFLTISGLYLWVGIGIGIILAAIARNQRQVVLTSFFINLPLIQLSGAIAPIESMPRLFQVLSLANPLRHYVTIIRGILLKGIGFAELWPNIAFLACFALVLMSISARQFRQQLS